MNNNFNSNKPGYSFCREQYEATIKFLSENNPYLRGKDDFLRKSLDEALRRMAESEDAWAATCGWILVRSESHIDIYVDPSVGQGDDLTFVK